MQKFLKEIAIGGRATYGVEQIKSALENNQVELILTANSGKWTAPHRVISDATQEGHMLRQAFGGIVAILYHKL